MNDIGIEEMVGHYAGLIESPEIKPLLEGGLAPGAIAVEMYRQLGHNLNLISALANMGEANLGLRRHEAAVTCSEERLGVVAGMDATEAERDGWRAFIRGRASCERGGWRRIGREGCAGW
jgi:hypothetical protein